MTQGIAVGDQIRIVRTIRNMGQVELAKRTGLSQFLISYFENGHAAPTHAQMVLIQEALGWPEGAEEAFAILAGGNEGPKDGGRRTEEIASSLRSSQ